MPVTPHPRQTILITGATDGLGRHLAEHLARSGAQLLLHGRDAGRGDETVRATIVLEPSVTLPR